MASSSPISLLLVAGMVAISISSAAYLRSATGTTSSVVSAPKKCRFSVDTGRITRFEKPIKEACAKSFKSDGPDCVTKCCLEKYGYLDKKGKIDGKAVETPFIKFTNATVSFRKAMVAVYENCAVDAGMVIKQLESNGTTLTKCKYEGWLHACVTKKQKEISRDISKFCPPNQDV